MLYRIWGRYETSDMRHGWGWWKYIGPPEPSLHCGVRWRHCRHWSHTFLSLSGQIKAAHLEKLLTLAREQQQQQQDDQVPGKSLLNLRWCLSSLLSNIYLQVFLAIVALAFAEPEPKPEADPWLYYSLGHYAAPWAYYPYHLGGYHYYGKRSAEAEPAPEANADPYYLYHGYYPYPYHGYYPYHGLGYYYGKRSAQAPAPAVNSIIGWRSKWRHWDDKSLSYNIHYMSNTFHNYNNLSNLKDFPSFLSL